jgi:hypothetical protein
MACPVLVRLDFMISAMLPYIIMAICRSGGIPPNLSVRYSHVSLRANIWGLGHRNSIGGSMRYSVYRGYRGTDNATL